MVQRNKGKLLIVGGFLLQNKNGPVNKVTKWIYLEMNSKYANAFRYRPTEDLVCLWLIRKVNIVFLRSLQRQVPNQLFSVNYPVLSTSLRHFRLLCRRL